MNPALNVPLQIILAERMRQIKVLGYDPERDADYDSGQLQQAAEAFLLASRGQGAWAAARWPWESRVNFDKSEIDLLARAGALILARLEVILGQGAPVEENRGQQSEPQMLPPIRTEEERRLPRPVEENLGQNTCAPQKQVQPAMDTIVDRARSLHRIVRALHDGHCPCCSAIFPAQYALTEEGESCPTCGFFISKLDAERAVREFAPIMDQSLMEFARWRAVVNGEDPNAAIRRIGLMREGLRK